MELPDPTVKDKTGRVIDIVAPQGMGQRALITAQPRTGKTESAMLLKTCLEGVRKQLAKMQVEAGRHIDTVILHALAKGPQDRFTSVSAFNNAFKQAQLINAPTNANIQTPPPFVKGPNFLFEFFQEGVGNILLFDRNISIITSMQLTKEERGTVIST